jgi:hypothetical protein
MGLRSLRIDGEPPTFNYPMSEREKAWRARVAAVIGNLDVAPQDGIRAEFTTSSDKRGGNYFDLDNMAKCVFDALSDRKPKYVELTRQVGDKPGVVLTVGLPESPPPPFLCCMAVRRGAKRDLVPEPALKGLCAFAGEAPLYVHLAFHEDVSLTDFGLSGAIKPALDCLWPLLGGKSARPHDYRIQRLVLRRSTARPSGVSVYMSPETGAPSPAVPVPPEKKKFPGPSAPESPAQDPRWRDVRRLAASENLSERRDALNTARNLLSDFLKRRGFRSDRGEVKKALQQYAKDAKAGQLNAQQLGAALEALDLRNMATKEGYKPSASEVTKAVDCLSAIVR